MKYIKNGLHLMCPWGFNPAVWGGIGFREEGVQNRLALKKPIIAIYVTKDSDLSPEKQGKVVGFVELSGKTGHIFEFISWVAYVKHMEKDENKFKWQYAVGMSRAWIVTGTNTPNAGDNWQDVENLFPDTRRQNGCINIGLWTAKVVEEEANFNRINELTLAPTKVYQSNLPFQEYETVGNLLRSRGMQLE